MNSHTVFVSADHSGETLSVGVIHATEKAGTVSGIFTYRDEWLARPDSYPIDPLLPLVTGAQPFSGSLPGALADSSPDRWGRQLIKKSLQFTGGTLAPRTISEVDYLLAASDETRQGALRFHREPDGPFLAVGAEVPPMVTLPRLRRAAWAFSRSDDQAESVRELLAAGTGSLGGARPKASVRDGETLRIAKFSHPGDEWDVIGLECVALDLAERCGIKTPARELLSFDDQSVLVVTRFDRDGPGRVPYLSAFSLTGLREGDPCDYFDVAESVMNHGGSVAKDLEALWRRLVFFVAINNVDDHPRNHGFLRHSTGWCLSPVFDVNPALDSAKRQMTILGASMPEECAGALREIGHAWGIGSQKQDESVESVLSGLKEVASVCLRRGISPALTQDLSALVNDRVALIGEHFPRAASLLP